MSRKGKRLLSVALLAIALSMLTVSAVFADYRETGGYAAQAESRFVR